MDLKEIVAISGMGGLFKVAARRNDGLIVQSFEEDHAKFVSNRVHIFTPLDGITLYTIKDNIELSKVLLEMKKQESSNPPVPSKGTNQQHKDYFRKIVSDFDEERVYVSDIKKVIKWFHLLDGKGLVVETAEAEAPAVEVAAEEKPKATKAAKATKAKDKEEGAEATATEEKPKAKKAAKPKE